MIATASPMAALLRIAPLIILAGFPFRSLSQEMHHTAAHEMTGAVLMTNTMSQEGSGTSWIPSSSPIYAKHWMNDDWMFMLHGNLFVRYTQQGGPRGGRKFDAPNWIMGMAQHPLGENGQIMFRSMVSLDRLTEGGSGYPLLFQTGESWQDQPLIDRQHPHDLFAELAVAYSHRFQENCGGFLYVGYPGEPALGPNVFMHRTSAEGNPDAPIDHHWQDATHISFGVATVGLALNRVKLEGSIFTGREPDEKRLNFDKPRFDSYSGRISYNPTSNLSCQGSYAFIKSPEALAPDIDVRRTTASLLYHEPFSETNWWSNTFVWGRNEDEHSGKQNSFLLESSFQLTQIAFFARFEIVEKPRGELGFSNSPEGKATVGEYTIGTLYDFMKTKDTDTGIGFQVTGYSKSAEFNAAYGSNPLSFEIFIRIRPALLSMPEMSMEM